MCCPGSRCPGCTHRSHGDRQSRSRYLITMHDRSCAESWPGAPPLSDRDGCKPVGETKKVAETRSKWPALVLALSSMQAKDKNLRTHKDARFFAWQARCSCGKNGR